MSNSLLATYIDKSTNNYNSRKYKITRITIHHAAGVMSLSDFSSLLRSTSRDVSWNYAISSDGKIGLYVDESNRAWTSSNGENDHRAITIEVSNNSGAPNWTVSDASYSALLDLCEDICRRNGIQGLSYTGKLSGSNLTRHDWFASTECPGPYLGPKFPDIAKEVNRRLGVESTIVYPDEDDYTYVDSSSSGTVSTIIEIDPVTLIAVDKIDPYIITLDRNSDDVDCEKLIEFGVVGAIIEAGRLYSVSHQEVYYKNPKLDDQIKSLLEHNIPVGLYTSVCARSLAEAKKEIDALVIWVQTYPPPLGVWLHLKLAEKTPNNDEIIEEYYNRLHDIGLKNKVGIYATRTQLSYISWEDNFCDKFALWLIDHLTEFDELDELLQPSLFYLDPDAERPTAVSPSTSIQVGSNTSYNGGDPDATLSKLSSGELTYDDVFSGFCFAGDSLMEGLGAYGVLDYSKLVTKVGATLTHLNSNYSTVVNKKPKTLILHYGINSISTSTSSMNNFIADYTKLVEKLKSDLPTTRIVISLLFPVGSGATAARFQNVNKYNSALITMCSKLSVEYVDSSPVFKEHPECWGSDGIHVRKSFYSDYWLKFLIKQLKI